MKFAIETVLRTCYCFVCRKKIYKDMDRVRYAKKDMYGKTVGKANYHIECFIKYAPANFHEFKGYGDMLRAIHSKDIKKERSLRMVHEL